MSISFDLSANELAALLCSKVCHDVISPVGALNMSLEMLDDPESGSDALDLVKQSAKSASARLQFCRLAFGASGSVGASIDTGDAEKVALAYMEGERADVVWNVERMILPKNKVKLLLNLMLIAAAAIPRGGTVQIRNEGSEGERFVLRAEGKRVRMPVEFDEMLTGDIPEGGIDAHSVQPYYTLLLANECGMSVDAELGDTDVTITVS